MKITDFNIKIDQENVLHLIDCYPDSPVYESVVDELEEILEEAYQKIRPAALLEFGSVEGYDLTEYGENITEALFNINSIGGALSEWSTASFAEGNYLRGMLIDAIADDYLFQIDKEIQESVISLCRNRGYGVVRRLEAPQDIPMRAQRTAWEVTKAREEIGLEIKESFMYDPVKSTCQIYLLDQECREFHTEHDCSKCSNLTCKMRKAPKVQITVRGGAEQVITGEKGNTLLEVLQQNQIFFPAVCAGRGTCGKCKVQFIEGADSPTEADQKFFSERELAEGWRLACKSVLKNDCVILAANDEEESFAIVTEYGETVNEGNADQNAAYAIAVDIGTTTIAMQLVNCTRGSVVDVYTAINRQRAYGADVISRMEASNHGKKEELQKSILEDLQQGLRALEEKWNIAIEKMVISANTTMVHLLMGYSCEGLGVYPFTPVNISFIHTTYNELFGGERTFPITILPGISTYVGGDIVAGLYACDFDRRDKVSMLVDLGTNGEMAIGCGDRILTTSTAAGPAFEGGNITFGTGSIAGAICNLTIENGKAQIKTIGDAAPKGICGTGVIDATYELLKEDLVDETGLLDEDYFEEGFPIAGDICFYQKDIREIQLAKSAVRAGLETLILRYGVTYDEIDKIYIAGGFGYKIDIEKAIGIGMFPEECREKIEAIGNSSLSGSVQYLNDPGADDRIEKLLQSASEVSLATDVKFNDFYMQYMYFD